MGDIAQYRQSDEAAEFRFRHDGWTTKRQHEFLSKLRESACVRDACKYVGLSSTSAYRTRARLPEFAAAWDAALALAMPRLEQAAYRRAVEGWDEPIVWQGKVVGQRRRYSDALLRLLIDREDRRPQRRAVPSSAEVDKIAGKLMQKLRWDDEKRLKDWETRMIAIGWAP